MVRILFEKCCLCIELRSGCLLIGYIQLVVNLVFVAGTALMMMANGVKPTMVLVWSSGLTYMGLSFGVVALCGLMVLVTVGLLVGLHCSWRCLVLCYLLFAALFVTIITPLFLLSFWKHIASLQSVVRDIFNMVWGTYGIFMIRSYYYSMGAPPAKEVCQGQVAA